MTTRVGDSNSISVVPLAPQTAEGNNSGGGDSGFTYAQIEAVVPGYEAPSGYIQRPRPYLPMQPRLRPHQRGLVRKFHDYFHIQEVKHKANDERRVKEYESQCARAKASYEADLKLWNDEQTMIKAALTKQQIHAQVPVQPLETPKTPIERDLEHMTIRINARSAERAEARKSMIAIMTSRTDAIKSMTEAHKAGNEPLAREYADDVINADDDIQRVQDATQEANKKMRIMKATLQKYEKQAKSVNEVKLLISVGAEIARLVDEEHAITETADGSVELDDEFWENGKNQSREDRVQHLLDTAAQWAAPTEPVLVKPQRVVQVQPTQSASPLVAS